MAIREETHATTRAAGTRDMDETRSAAESAVVAAYRDVAQGTLLALAMKELAGNLPQINSLVLTPDLLAPVLARLAGADGS